MRGERKDDFPPKYPKTLVDIDNPDDGEILEGGGGGGPEEEELPEYDVPEIQLPDDGADILENHGSPGPGGDRPFRSK